MTSVTVERHIEAPVEEVFATASDFPTMAERIAGIDRVEMLTAGDIGVGTRFRETRTLFGRQASEEMEVAEFEPPHRYAVVAESHGSRYWSEFRFAPSGSGTAVAMTFQATPLTLLAKVMSFLMKGMIKKVAALCAQDLEDLKAHLEGARPDG